MTALVKRAVKFFLHKTFGHFLKEKLDLSQLDIDFKAGIVHLTHLELNNETINSLLGELPVELRSGWIEHAWVTVPLKNITTSLVDNCKLELEGLRLTFAPRKVKRPRTLKESRVWGTNSDYGSRSAFNVAASISESVSVDHESVPEEAYTAPLTGERELNQIIDQLLLILENVRLKNLSIELEYFCPSLGEEAVLCVEIPSFEYSDITRHAKTNNADAAANTTQEAGPSSPTTQPSVAEWNPSALIKCIKFPALSASLDRKSALPPSGRVDGRGDHRSKKGHTMLVVAQRPNYPGDNEDSPKKGVSCPWAESVGLSGSESSDASVIYVKLKRNKTDVSIPDLDVDCTLQQVTTAISAEQLQMLIDLSAALDAMIVSPASSPPPPPASNLRESSGARMAPSLVRSPSPPTAIPAPEEDLYSNQPSEPDPAQRTQRAARHRPRSSGVKGKGKALDGSGDSENSPSDDSESFYECAPEDDWFQGAPREHKGSPQEEAEPCPVAHYTLLNLQAVVRVVGGSLNLIYGSTSPTLCGTIADLPPTRQKRPKPSRYNERRGAVAYEKGKEKQDNAKEFDDERVHQHLYEDDEDDEDDLDGAHDEEDDSIEERVGDRLALEFESLFVQTWGSLLQTRVEISADTLSVYEYLAVPSSLEDQEESRSEQRRTVLSFAVPPMPSPPRTQTPRSAPDFSASPSISSQSSGGRTPSLSATEGSESTDQHNLGLPQLKCAIMQTNKSLQVELPGDVFDLDIETVVHPLNVFLDLKMLDRLSQFANVLQSNKSVGEDQEGLAHLHVSTRAQQLELKSSRIRAGVQGGLCIVLYSTGVPRSEQIVLRVSDQVGPRATTHMHSDQSEAVWLVEFDQLSASLDRQPATTLYSHLHRASTERTFFEAQMRNTQNEVVIPLEVAIRTDRWKPSFTFVQDITLTDTLPDEAWHQENLGSFWNFFSIFEGRGHQQAMAEATDYSKVIVTLRFPSSHVDLSKSDYDLIVKLLGSGSSDADRDATSLRETLGEQRPNTINLAEAVSSPNLLDARRRSSLDYPYGELVQKRQNALALNVFFTQGNWVFREITRREDAEANEGKNNSSPPPHCYELEFVKLHIFQLMQHAGMDANYTVLTGEDFIIHDTISFDNTTPVAERIHRMRKEEVRPMFRGLIQTSKGNTECRFMFDEVVMHHHKGLNWLVSLSDFFTPSKSEEEKQRDRERKNALRARRKQQSNDELAVAGASAFRIGLAFNQLEIEYTSLLLPSQAMATIDLLSVSSDDIVAGSDEDVFRGTLQTLTVYLMDTMRQRPVSSSISDSADRSGIGGSGLRRRASSITSSGLPPGDSVGYWQHKGYTKVASLDHLDWDIISRSAAYHVEANLPELEINVVSDPSPTCSLTACSDSLQTLLDLVGEWTAPPQKDLNAPEQQKPELKADLNPLAAALNQVQWDDVAANAFAPKTRSNERKPPRDRHRPGRSKSGGKTSGGQPSSTAKKQSSLAAQIKAAEDYDPSASSSGRFVIREDYLSSSSSPDVGRKGKGKEKQESSSHQLQRQHPDTRTRPAAKARTRAKASKDMDPARTRRRRRGSDDSSDSSSDIDVDWSSSSTIVDSWDDVVEGKDATQNNTEPKAADPWEQTFADEEEEDYEDEDKGGDEEENNDDDDDDDEEGGDVVDGEKIGLERGRKYKLVVEKFPAADALRQPAETVPAPMTPSNVPLREPQARWLTGDAPQLDGLLINDFARAPPKSPDFGFTLPEGYPLPKLRVFARVDVVVRLVGGADWATPTGSLVASTSSSGGAAASTDGSDGSWKALPKAGSRNEEVNMQIAVTNLEIQLNELVPGAQHVRRLVVSVGEVEVQDNVPSSDVKTFMCYDRDRPRETGSSMLAVQMECVRPDRAAKPEAEEWRLKVRSLPLRLYIDQDALEFLVQYFSAMEGSPVIPEGEPLYFQSCEVKSVHLKVDYQPKQLDYNALYGDNKVAFFAKAVPLRAAEIHLKPVRVKGRGWDELLGKRLVEAYLPYISRTQLSSVVAGIAPIRSLLNITSGVGDLIYTPMQQWQKDGRILTGLQRGASTALHKWLVEGLNVGTNLTAGAQYVLEAADYYLGGSGGSIAGSSMYAHAPATTEAGMRDAYSSVSRELGAAAHRIVAVPLDQYQKHGATGYLSSLASGVPLAILRPIIGVTEGVTKTLIGVQKWVDPALEDEIATKFKKKPKRQADHHHQYHHRHRQPGVTESRIFASDDDDDYYSRSIDNEEGDTLASQVGGAFYYGASVLGSALPRFGSAAAAAPTDSLESSSSSYEPASAFTRRYVSEHYDDNFSDDDSTDDSDV